MIVDMIRGSRSPSRRWCTLVGSRDEQIRQAWIDLLGSYFARRTSGVQPTMSSLRKGIVVHLGETNEPLLRDCSRSAAPSHRTRQRIAAPSGTDADRVADAATAVAAADVRDGHIMLCNIVADGRETARSWLDVAEPKRGRRAAAAQRANDLGSFSSDLRCFAIDELLAP